RLSRRGGCVDVRLSAVGVTAASDTAGRQTSGLAAWPTVAGVFAATRLGATVAEPSEGNEEVFDARDLGTVGADNPDGRLCGFEGLRVWRCQTLPGGVVPAVVRALEADSFE